MNTESAAPINAVLPLIAVSEGKEFLDFKTNTSGVLYYALEDSKARLKDRLNKILISQSHLSRLYILF